MGVGSKAVRLVTCSCCLLAYLLRNLIHILNTPFATYPVYCYSKRHPSALCQCPCCIKNYTLCYQSCVPVYITPSCLRYYHTPCALASFVHCTAEFQVRPLYPVAGQVFIAPLEVDNSCHLPVSNQSAPSLPKKIVLKHRWCMPAISIARWNLEYRALSASRSFIAQSLDNSYLPPSCSQPVCIAVVTQMVPSAASTASPSALHRWSFKFTTCHYPQCPTVFNPLASGNICGHRLLPNLSAPLHHCMQKHQSFPYVTQPVLEFSDRQNTTYPLAFTQRCHMIPDINLLHISLLLCRNIQCLQH